MQWLKETVDKIIREFGSKEKIVCNGGLSVSGLQHCGRLRGEVTYNDVVSRELRKLGYTTVHSLVLYTVDPWKGKETQLKQFSNPKEALSYRGYPLFKVPDPFGCHSSWVDHYWEDFGNYLKDFAVDVKIVTTEELYKKNEKMKDFVKKVIEKKELVRRVINKYRGRKPYPKGWIPFEPICEKCGRIDTTEATSVDLKSYRVKYTCLNCGYSGETSMENGKLMWRLEWVGIWYSLEVCFEPFGKDHAMPGGSRDSCVDLALNVFKLKPPVGLAYEWVGYSVRGRDIGDMGSSDFIGFTPKDWLEVAEPEVLRYLYLFSDPMKRVVLSLEQIPSYTEKFDRAERIFYELEETKPNEDKERIVKSYKLALLSDPPKSPPFQLSYYHAVALCQVIPEERDLLEEALKRLKATGILKKEKLDEYSLRRIKSRLERARRWVKKYAPSVYRIKPSEELSTEALRAVNVEVVPLLEALLENLKRAEWNENEIKKSMMAVPKKSKSEEKKFFKALYLIFFAKDRGPRIAFYLAMLDKKWVLDRLSEALKELKAHSYS
ncbi:MAG: lysine--tRNA ligase [Thermoprotei archaeon]|nr:MAG: lysine--tRNA ligase [Thermoprotei archaeon]